MNATEGMMNTSKMPSLKLAKSLKFLEDFSLDKVEIKLHASESSLGILTAHTLRDDKNTNEEIGRASCRERV